MSGFYDRWLEEAKATAVASMSDKFPILPGVAFLFTGRRMPERIRQGRFDPALAWPEELRAAVAAHGPEGVLFRIRLSLTEDWPVEWSESVDRTEKDAAVICLFHRDLPQPMFWAAAVKDPSEPYIQLGSWIEIDGSSVPEEYRTIMDGP
jgi:hypothetical protein